MLSVLVKPAVHQCWAIADLCERQTCIGVTVVTGDWCQLFLQSSGGPESMLVSWSNLLCISVGRLHTCVKGKLA